MATHCHSVIKVPVEDTCSYLDHNVVIDNSGRHAIATALGETIKAVLLAWGSRSSRLASVLLKGATMNHNVIAVCALTLDAEEEVKGAFYGDLQGAVDSVYQGDVLIVAGDWNATSGAADVAIRHILGRSDLDR